MKFVVTRTNLSKNKKPCDEAEKSKTTYTYNDKTKDVWIIEIKDLEDLMKFSKKYGNLVIGECPYKEFPFVVEIYDDYRE